MKLVRSYSLHRSGLLTDSYPVKWDISKSFGSYFIDTENNKYLDFHGGFGSLPLSWNNSKLTERMSKENMSLFVNKISNSDFYTEKYFGFVDKFKNKVVPQNYDYLFFIDGGALAVENALKVAIDAKKCDKILHFEGAFHGRTGYTMSLTNTEPIKTEGFPKFDWPRCVPSTGSDERTKITDNQSLVGIENQIKETNGIAAMIIEPIQCEGGDRHFTKKYLQGLQKICNDNDLLFILDEVQTGFYTSGKRWCFEHYDLEPDIVCFGKKSQQCGIFAKKERLGDDNCFTVSNRISSTWGGNLVDMIRSSHIIDIINEDNLMENAKLRGEQWLEKIKGLVKRFEINNPREKGLLMAFDCDSKEFRDKLLEIMKHNGLLGLGCGEKTIRFRPNLSVTEEEIDECVDIIEKSMKKMILYYLK